MFYCFSITGEGVIPSLWSYHHFSFPRADFKSIITWHSVNFIYQLLEGCWHSGGEHDVTRIAQVVECAAANSNANPGEHISRFTHYLLRVAVEREGRDQTALSCALWNFKPKQSVNFESTLTAACCCWYSRLKYLPSSHTNPCLLRSSTVYCASPSQTPSCGTSSNGTDDSLAFSIMIRRLKIWSLVPTPCRKPIWTSAICSSAANFILFNNILSKILLAW